MTGKHTIFDTRRESYCETRDLSPAPYRPDNANLRSSFLAERGVTRDAVMDLPDEMDGKDSQSLRRSSL
jgi:hypothetical protein